MGSEIPLYRQIHPKWIQDGMITSEAFRPFDGDLLSLYNGEMINAEDSFKHYTEECGNVSCGVAEVAESVFVKKDRKSTRLNSSHHLTSRMPSSA